MDVNEWRDGPVAWHDDQAYGSEVADGLDEGDQHPEEQPQSEQVHLPDALAGRGERGEHEAQRGQDQQDQVEDGHAARVDPTPVYDTLLAEWTEHYQQVRLERIRSGWRSFGQTLRNLGQVFGAMDEGIKDGLRDR